MKHYHLLFLALVVGVAVLISSCEEPASTTDATESFTAIFDNRNFDASYFPIDMQQTADGGYLVLGGRRLTDSDYVGIYLLKADKYGNFVKELEVDESSVHPVGKLARYKGKYYFFCMNASTTNTELAELDANLSAITMKSVTGSTYPVAATLIDNGSDSTWLLQSYNHVDKKSVVCLVNKDGLASRVKSFDIGEGDGVEEPIVNHFLRTGRQFPFEVGKVTNNLYFFNGFYQYTFSLVFTDLSADDPKGVIQGTQDDAGMSAVVPLSTTKFASATFSFGDNVLLPNAALSTQNTADSYVNYPGYSLPELVSNARIRIVRASIDSKNVVIYGSDTRSRQIGLYFYDESTGALLGSRYLGFSNPFEIASIQQTADGGLAVCGTTYLAGRFPRICIFKLSKANFREEIQP